MNESQITIKCPQCSQKALFRSSWNNDFYVLRPEEKGKVICTNCGYSGSKDFTSADYYYQIPIKDRSLYARTLEDLITIRDYFQEHKKNTEPELDFPKSFYENRDEIVKKINDLLKEKPGCNS